MALQRTAGNRSTARLLQRAMKLELQTGNVIWKAREGEPTEKLPRKFGPQAFIHKGTQGKRATRGKEGTAVELQSENGGFVCEGSLPAGVPQAQPSGQVVGARVRAR